MPLTLPPALTQRSALLLDLDGTLIDLAQTPDAVVVPADLPGVLGILRERLGGALALISGRPIAALDALLPGVPAAVAGEHGAAIRLTPGGDVLRTGALLPQDWHRQAQALVMRFPGAIAEQKPGGVTLHFRECPEAGEPFRLFADTLVQGTAFVVLAAKMAWEIKPGGINKGGALRTIMAGPPFAGRMPVFVGDDVTDLPAIEAARDLGGVGLFVPDVFGDPEGVRRWLRASAAQSVRDVRG